MDLGPAISVTWKISVLLELAVAVRLLQQGLAGVYPALLTACSVLPIKSLVLMYVYAHVPAGHARQARILTENLAPVEWFLFTWVVLELFSRWTRNYKGIGRFGKLLLLALLVGAVLVSCAVWPAEWSALDFAGNFRIYYILNRVIFGALGLFVLGTWQFFQRHPVPIPVNVTRHTRISVAYFGGGALGFLLFTLFGLKYVAIANLYNLFLSVVCFAIWTFALSREGEATIAARQISLEEKKRVEQINQELLSFMGELGLGKTRR